MDRDLVKQKLLESQEPMMAFFLQQKGNRPLFGELLSVEIGGEKHRMRYYPGKGPKSPMYFDIHGGGFVWGTMEDGDLFCHAVNERFGFAVFAPEYPLTPQAEYPQALDWLYETIQYLRTHAETYQADAANVIVGGRSAGGNLAAALCQKARCEGTFQFRLQVLDHPWLDLCRMIPEEERYQAEDTLSLEMLEGMAIGYADEEQRSEIFCSPLAAKEAQMRELSPAIIQTCEMDSLRADGDLYAERLKEAGVRVIHHCFRNALHGFTEGTDSMAEEGRRWLLDAMDEMLFGG
ncbi:MAG: alpha/beta hydrolase [Eubacteriales bacterium]|nr:alpha/beta hydrolase [Eubacteriales bacterium]